MYDLVDDETSVFRNTEQPISPTGFENIFKQTADLLNLSGHLANNATKWVNYCDVNRKEDPYIDNLALKFLVNVIKHRGGRHEPGEAPSINFFTKQLYGLRKYVKDLPMDKLKIIIAVCIVMLAAFLSICGLFGLRLSKVENEATTNATEASNPSVQ